MLRNFHTHSATTKRILGLITHCLISYLEGERTGKHLLIKMDFILVVSQVLCINVNAQETRWGLQSSHMKPLSQYFTLGGKFWELKFTRLKVARFEKHYAKWTECFGPWGGFYIALYSNQQPMQLYIFWQEWSQMTP